MTLTILLILACCCASFVQRVGGFGFGIIIMTVLPYLLPSYGEATTLSGLLAAMQSVFVAISMHKHIQWRALLPILITFCIVSSIAIVFVASINDSILKKILGVTLLGVSIYFLFFSDRIKVKPTMPIQISMGTISGLMGGFFAMQGPPAVLYFLASLKTKEQYMASLQTYLLLGNIIMTISRARAGFLTATVGIDWCYCLIGVVIGTSLGSYVFKRIPTPILKKIIYIYIAISGISALL